MWEEGSWGISANTKPFWALKGAMDLSWECLSAGHSAVCCQGESVVLLGSICPPVPSQAWWCPVGHPWPGLKGLGDDIMARGATWGTWPPPHAHGPAQQWWPCAQAGPSKGLGQPMKPGCQVLMPTGAPLSGPRWLWYLIRHPMKECSRGHMPFQPSHLPNSEWHAWVHFSG